MVLKADFEALEKRVSALEKAIKAKDDQLTEKNQKIEELIEKLEDKNCNDEKGNEELWTDVVKGKQKRKSINQLNLINAVAKESKERKMREKNVIIFGLAASTNKNKDNAFDEDKKNVITIFNKIDANVNIEHIINLKTRNENQPPFIVVLKDKHERNKVLKSSKVLKDDDSFSKVFINPDLTEAERHKAKLLKEECHRMNTEKKQRKGG